MTAPPAIPTIAAGQRASASYAATLKATVEAFAGGVACYAFRTVAGTPASGSWTPIGLDGETSPGFDTGMHDPTANNSRIIVPYDGLYHIEARVSFLANATGLRGVAVRKNSAGSITGGTPVAVERVTAPTATEGRTSLSIDFRAVTGDYFELFGYQSSGGGLGLSVVDPFENMLQVRLVGY